MYYIKQLPHNTHIALNFIFFQTLSLKNKLITISKLYNLKFFCLFSSFLYQQFPDSFAKIIFFVEIDFLCGTIFFHQEDLPLKFMSLVQMSPVKLLKCLMLKKETFSCLIFGIFFSPIVILQFALQYFQALIS